MPEQAQPGTGADPKITPPAVAAAPAADPPAQTAQPDPPAEPAVPSDWPDDWRDRFTKKAPVPEREKLQKRLSRFTSPDNVLSSYLELERKLSAGQLKPVLPEGASEEEVKSYRKSVGIPDEATPEAYGVTWPENFEASEADQADLKDFVGVLHSKNVPPAVAQDLWKFYQGVREKAEGQMYEAAQNRTVEHRSEIRAEFGRDFERNLRAGNAFLASHIGEEKAKSLTSATLADGTKLGDHPDFVRLFVGAALKTSDDAEMARAEVDSGQSVNDAYEAMLEVRYTDPKKYNSIDFQQKLMRLAASKAKTNKSPNGYPGFKPAA